MWMPCFLVLLQIPSSLLVLAKLLGHKWDQSRDQLVSDELTHEEKNIEHSHIKSCYALLHNL